MLYDPACEGGADLATDFSDRARKVKRLDKLLAKDHRAWVTLEGVF